MRSLKPTHGQADCAFSLPGTKDTPTAIASTHPSAMAVTKTCRETHQDEGTAATCSRSDTQETTHPQKKDNTAKAPRSGAGSRIPPLQGCPDGMRACSCCAEPFCGSALLEITQTPMSLSRGTQHLPPSKANRNHCSTQDSLGGILI